MKRILTFALVTVLLLGMAAQVAAAGPTIDGLRGDNALEQSYLGNLGVSGAANLRGSASVSNRTVTYQKDIVPSHKIKDTISLYVDAFTWKNGTPTNAGGRLSAAQIKDGKIGVRTSVAAGSKAIENVGINRQDGTIEIEYLTEFVSTEPLDFEFTVYLTIDGKRYNKGGLTFVGTLANPEVLVYQNDDYVSLAGGEVAHAQEFVKNIEVDLGSGVSIHTKFFKGKKYYGTASRDADEYDDAVFAKYPDVDNVITLRTVGLNSTGDIVRLDTDYGGYYVYDKDLAYLGRSNEMLPYRSKYYLANRKLDVTGVPDPAQPEPAPEPGDGTGIADNPSRNPQTGGGAAWHIAAIAAALSLATAAALGFKFRK